MAEHRAPEKIQPSSLADYLEVMSKAVFQSGISWKVVEAMLELERQPGPFRSSLRSHGGFEGTVADLRKRFKFLGDMGAYYFLWVVDEEVPPYEDWCASRGRTPITTH